MEVRASPARGQRNRLRSGGAGGRDPGWCRQLRSPPEPRGSARRSPSESSSHPPGSRGPAGRPSSPTERAVLRGAAVGSRDPTGNVGAAPRRRPAPPPAGGEQLLRPAAVPLAAPAGRPRAATRLTARARRGVSAAEQSRRGRARPRRGRWLTSVGLLLGPCCLEAWRGPAGTPRHRSPSVASSGLLPSPCQSSHPGWPPCPRGRRRRRDRCPSQGGAASASRHRAGWAPGSAWGRLTELSRGAPQGPGPDGGGSGPGMDGKCLWGQPETCTNLPCSQRERQVFKKFRCATGSAHVSVGHPSKEMGSIGCYCYPGLSYTSVGFHARMLSIKVLQVIISKRILSSGFCLSAAIIFRSQEGVCKDNFSLSKGNIFGITSRIPKAPFESMGVCRELCRALCLSCACCC